MQELAPHEKAPVNTLNGYGLVERWLVLGPFPNGPIDAAVGAPTREAYDRDFLLALGGEASAEIAESTTIPTELGLATVTSIRAPLTTILNVERLYEGTDGRAVYAFCYIDTDSDELVMCDFGSDDGAKVWVNGQLAHAVWTAGRTCVTGQERFAFRLAAGRNRVLVKLENNVGSWEFSFRAYRAEEEAIVKANTALLSSMRGHPPLDGAEIRPMISEFGQYRNADWPGKTHSVADLRAALDAEAAELAADSGPADWNRYGGWDAGPTLAATGYFRTEKVDGKWWLVDPLGKLFFSHGIDNVCAGELTPLEDRRDWFERLPDPGGEFRERYASGRSLHGYYAGRTVDSFDFSGANLMRKYGAGWRDAFIATAHSRLRHWGLNTFACWSDRAVCAERRTPYTLYLKSGGRPLAGSGGYWRSFADVFDPSFRASLDSQMAGPGALGVGDPWCIGYFVDNELTWGEPGYLAESTLKSEADQPAKAAFRDWLHGNYGEIDNLNAAWNTGYATWGAFLLSVGIPDTAQGKADFVAFSRVYADRYFRTCKEAIKAIAPNQLYLGCRFAHAHPEHGLPAAAAAKHCDVVSYNLYKLSIEKVVLPDPSDVPVLIGEFHFGALDRGVFHPGLRQVDNQEARAETYIRYVRSVLDNPQYVGCHWFQYRDSPTSGRVLDGENYQIGFVDACDHPYAETVRASRKVGEELYRLRFESATR
jgi:hypothetical protein